MIIKGLKIGKRIKVRCLTAALAAFLGTSFLYAYDIKAEEAEVSVEETPVSEEAAQQQEPVPMEDTNVSGRTILPNIYIGNVNVGGMSVDEAKNACAAYVDEINAASVNFVCGTETATVPLSELGISTDVDSVVNTACEYGHKGNILRRHKELKDLENGGEKRLSLSFSISGDAYANLENTINGFNHEPASASIEMVDGSFQIQPEMVGVVVDTQAAIDEFQITLNNTSDFTDFSVDIPHSEAEPEVTSEELNGITDKLGEYTTSYGGGDAGRMANVENACAFINGTVVLPGEEFDTDATIRPYTEENGYHYAGEYSNGTVVQGLGGGVCQVSTTLYNAVLYAELEVTERYSHSLTVGYVKLSQDAAISGTVKNFRFRNNTDTPIYIAGACEDGKITFAIFGKETRPENRTLEFESVLVETISPGEPEVTVDESLPAGTRTVTQKAHTGYVAELWKHVYVDGQLTDSVKVNSSQYMSTPEKVTVSPDEAGEGGEEPPAEENTEAQPTEAPLEPATEAQIPEGAPEDPPAE